jgi:ABC-2 type transport system ATP-binding protein
MSPPLLLAQGLAQPGLFQDLSLRLSAGECWALVGVNGAGKSTLCATLAGALRPHAGAVVRNGALAYLPEGCPLEGGPKVGDWLTLLSRLPDWEPDVAAEVLKALPLPLDQPAQALSLGQRSRLGLLLTLSRDVPILVLDDPFLGLDPGALAAAWRLLSVRADASRALLFATADLSTAARLATHLALLRPGAPLRSQPLDDWSAEAAAAGRRLEAHLAAGCGA